MLRILVMIAAVLTLSLQFTTTVSAQTKSEDKRIDILEKKIDLKSSTGIRKLFKIENGKLITTKGQSSGIWLCNGSHCFCDYRVFDCTEGSEICKTRNDGQPDATCHEGICECERGKQIAGASGGLAPAEYLE